MWMVIPTSKADAFQASKKINVPEQSKKEELLNYLGTDRGREFISE